MSKMFDQSNDANNEPTENKSAEELFNEMVGEGKKYQTPAELAKAYFHANSHIDRLERENDEYRVKTEAAKSVDEILARLNPQSEPHNTSPSETRNEEIGKDKDIDELVQQAVERKLQEKAGATNAEQVSAALKAKFGSQAKEAFEAKEKELGLDLEQLSHQSPQAVLALFGATSPSLGRSDPPASGDHHNQARSVPQEGTRAYAQYMYDQGKISRDQKFALLHQYASNPELLNSQRSYK